MRCGVLRVAPFKINIAVSRKLRADHKVHIIYEYIYLVDRNANAVEPNVIVGVKT